MNVLVTGGAGYIGSHTCVELLNAGHEVFVVDNLHNSKEESLERVQEVTGRSLTFHKVDLLDREALRKVFAAHRLDAVIHFAALKAVGESVSMPLEYYVHNLVFSSSATVYGEDNQPPLVETMRTSATNPYGWSKVMMEQVFQDWHTAEPQNNIILLRYFNPVGAHPSGRIGEDPNGIPLNLLPFVTQVVVGVHERLNIFGNDYPTPDGTCLRDYIHVVDLAIGHVKALEKLEENPGVEAYNLGTGRPYSVLEVVESFKRVTGQDIPYQIVDRRLGDLPTSYADPSKANNELNWHATRTLDKMCADAWRWQSNNPNGYNES
jgi:UDP-glucose 4-epimerase